MKAAVRYAYGPPESIRIEEIDKPGPAQDEVLVRVACVSLNASDWESLTGSPAYARIWGAFAPRFKVLGSDLTGTVEAVGSGVTEFSPGDQVFGDVMGHFGGFAEYAVAPSRLLKRKPSDLTFEQASTLLQSGSIAVQGLCDAGHLMSEQHVLINGGGGGSGTLAIQLAKHIGAQVTAIDNHKKQDLMRRLGADHVFDYEQGHFTERSEQYDLILDLFATRSPLQARKALRPGGRYLAVGGNTNRILELATLGAVLSPFGKRLGVLTARQNVGVDRICDFVRRGVVQPIIDRTFTLQQTAEALRYLGEGNALGKVVLEVSDQN